MSTVTRHGSLATAGNSGHISFTAGTELPGFRVESFKPRMILPKPEGGAVFTGAGEEERPRRGGTLLEALEHACASFRDRHVFTQRGATCPACHNIPSLDSAYCHGREAILRSRSCA